MARPEPWESNEPTLDKDNYSGSLVRVLNYHNTEVPDNLKFDWAINFWRSKGIDVKNLLCLDPGVFKQVGVIARLVEKGAPVSETHKMYLMDFPLKYQPEQKKKHVHVEKQQKVDRTQDIASEICGEIDGEIDKLICGGKTFNVKNYVLGRHMTKSVMEIVNAYIEKLKSEFVVDYDEDTYNITKKSYKQIVDFLEAFYEYTKQQKRVVKRVTKEKPASVIASKVKYMLEYPPLRIKSVHPSKIIGANTVYVFNVKVRKMYRYVAIRGEKLTIVGSSIKNYDVEVSTAKTIRKPEDFIVNTFNVSQKQIYACFDAIKTLNVEASGRITDDMIVYAVY